MKIRNDFLIKIKEKLVDRKEEMMQLLTESSQDKVSDGQVQDAGDEALSITMEKLQNSLEQTEIDELRLIEEAIARINKGEFGACVDCEEPISDKRLENFPYAARCIVCQEALEEEHL